MATRHKEFASLCRKVMAMRNKVNDIRARPAPEKSSVGLIEAPNLDVEDEEIQKVG